MAEFCNPLPEPVPGRSQAAAQLRVLAEGNARIAHRDHQALDPRSWEHHRLRDEEFNALRLLETLRLYDELAACRALADSLYQFLDADARQRFAAHYNLHGEALAGYDEYCRLLARWDDPGNEGGNHDSAR